MARRSAVAASPSQAIGPVRRGFRVGMQSGAALAAFLFAIWIYTSAEQFLLTDSRFFLPGPPEPGVTSEFFKIENAVQASEQQVTNVFLRDFGRSIYLCPIQERRRKLLAIDWIKDATVIRVWPNRLIVQITERSPVAYLQVKVPDGTIIYSLVDAEGVLLDPQGIETKGLPVLSGFPSDEVESSRRERVKRFLRMQSEIGAYMDKISEIDISDVDNLRITQQFDNRALTLMLGNKWYKERLENFLDNQEEIRQRLPGARILDLRLKGRITAVGGEQ